MENLQKEAGELQALIVDYQREMQRKEAELTTPILQGCSASCADRLARGLRDDPRKRRCPYFRSDLEVTDRTIQMYNSGQAGDATPGGKGPAAPAGKTPAAPPKAGTAPAPAPSPAPAPGSRARSKEVGRSPRAEATACSNRWWPPWGQRFPSAARRSPGRCRPSARR